MTVRTTGTDPDPDGYAVAVDSVVRAVAANDTVMITGIAAGEHRVAVTGIASNCVVDGENMRVDATISERLRAVRRAFEEERRKTAESVE